MLVLNDDSSLPSFRGHAMFTGFGTCLELMDFDSFDNICCLFTVLFVSCLFLLLPFCAILFPFPLFASQRVKFLLPVL